MERNNIRASDSYVLSQNKKAGWFNRHPAFPEMFDSRKTARERYRLLIFAVF
jgi:hypothetical protein